MNRKLLLIATATMLCLGQMSCSKKIVQAGIVELPSSSGNAMPYSQKNNGNNNNGYGNGNGYGNNGYGNGNNNSNGNNNGSQIANAFDSYGYADKYVDENASSYNNTIGGYEKKDMHFKVQIGAFEEPLNDANAYFSPVEGQDLRTDISPFGLHRYSLGFFKNYKEADTFERMLKSKGYHEAFVVAYGDDNRRIELPMSEILSLYNRIK